MVAILLVLLGTASLGAAPAPLPRPARPGGSPLPRYCVLVWHGGEYDARFDADGTYYAAGGDKPDYEGGWSSVGGTITVRERAAGHGGPYLLVWTFPATGREGAIHVRPHENRKIE